MENFEELKGTVAQTLEAQGVLSSIRAQLRAAVFSAIDEEEKKSDEHTNASNLDRLSNDAAGSAMLGLVQEFLSFYNFQYSLSVLHSESGQSDQSSSTPDRASLERQLSIQSSDASRPLLAAFVDVPPPRRLMGSSANISASSPAASPVAKQATPHEVSPAASSPGAGLSSPSPVKTDAQPALGALHHSPSSQQLLQQQDDQVDASPEATDDELAAALSAALQDENEGEAKLASPPPAAQAPAFGLSALPSLSLGTAGSLEGLRDRLPAQDEEKAPPAAPRGPHTSTKPAATLDVSDSFEDTVGSSSKGGEGSMQPQPAPHAADSDEEYGSDEDWEEEELPDEVSDDEEEGGAASSQEEEVLVSTAVPMAALAASLSPSKRSEEGDGDDLGLSMGDSRSMGDSGTLQAPLASGAGSPAAQGGAAEAESPLESSWLEEGTEALEAFDHVETVQK